MFKKDQLILENLYEQILTSYKRTLFEELINQIIHPNVLSQTESHKATQTEEKQKIIQEQIDYFNLTNSLGGNVYLGVVGAGSGLQNHIEEAKRMGYSDLKKVHFFEMVRKHFLDLLKSYLEELLLISEPYFPIKQIFQNKDVLKPLLTTTSKQDKKAYELNGILSDSSNLPNLLWSEIPLRGTDLKSSLSHLQGVNINPSDVTHIDFDITASIKSNKEVVETTLGFFETYPNLKSLVQVYSWQRGLREPESLTKWEKFYQEWQDCFEAIRQFSTNENTEIPFKKRSKTVKLETIDREEDAVKSVVRRDGGKSIGEKFAEQIHDQLKKQGIGNFVQLYGGAGGPSMISVSAIKSKDSLKVKPRDVEGEGEKKRALEYVKKVEEFLSVNKDYPLNNKLKNFAEEIELFCLA